MWNELRSTLRNFSHNPLLAAVVISTLMLGIGGSTAIFSVFNAVLLRKLPYPDPGQIYLMNSVAPDGSLAGISPVELRPFYEEKHPMVQAATLAWSQEVQIVGSDQKAYPTTRYGVTDQFFEVFGRQMYLGQPFKRGQMPGVIVLTYSTWRERFDADPKIIGKTVKKEFLSGNNTPAQSKNFTAKARTRRGRLSPGPSSRAGRRANLSGCRR